MPLPVQPYRTIKIGAAPMEGVTDFPMRLWLCHTSAPDYTATPFLRATPGFPKRAIPTDFFPEGTWLKHNLKTPCLPQVMAAANDPFLRAAEKFRVYTDALDINCGCPAPTVIGRGAGSSLLATPESFARRIAALARELGGEFFGVKMRTGFDHDDDYPALIGGLAGIKLRRLTIHGRTKTQGYKGQASWDNIRLAAKNLQPQTPVVASGDVVSPSSLAAKLAAAPEVSEVIVGRGLLRNPWLVAEIRQQQPQSLTPKTLQYALGMAALYHELFYQNPAALFEFLAGQTRADPFWGTSEEAWQGAYENFAQHFTLPIKPTELATNRWTVGRLKQIWHYLRSSLPPALFEPKVMRAQDAGPMLAHIHQLAGGCQQLTLRHQPQYDPLYAGMGKA